MGSRLIFFLYNHTSHRSRRNNTLYIEDPTTKGPIMTTLLALVIAPFVVISALLIVGEILGKKNQWN